MLTVHEVSELAGISVRTLHHYDAIGLLEPHARTEAGYRLYDEQDLARLQQILLFRELEFPLTEIRRIIDSPDFDTGKALEQQLHLLELKREHIEKLISMTKDAMKGSVSAMSFEAFDTGKMDEYAKQAKAAWGNTPEWADYEKKREGRSMQDEAGLGNQLMELFKPFGTMAAQGASPASEDAQAQAAAIQAFISEHFYECSNETFAQLGATYGAGGDFTSNINAAAGAGAAEFAAEAIKRYCA